MVVLKANEKRVATVTIVIIVN